MLELLRQTNKQVCKNKNTQKSNSSLTLPLLLTFKEKELKPYWNLQCQKLQSALWLPQITDSKEMDLSLSNYNEEKLNHWNKILKPIKSPPTNLSISLPSSAIPTISKNQQRGRVKATTVKKIRFYPENEEKYLQALTLYRRAYNLAVSHYIEDSYKDTNGKFINLRPKIKEQCKTEQEAKEAIYNSIIVDNAVLSAKETFNKILKKNKQSNKNFSKIRFKSKKGDIHSFSIDRMPKNLSPASKALEKITLTEDIPKEAIGKSVTVTYNKGRWFIQVKQYTQTNSEIQGSVDVVAIDPGIRTFATTYSNKEVMIIGDKFAQRKLYPLMKKVDRLISQKTKLLNLKFKDSPPQWFNDRLKQINKKINRLKCRKDDLINDLHHKLSYELVSNYDVIFLPTFETKQIASKKGERKIRRITARSMLDLNHYKFKLTLKWYADKYGKHVVDCNESYTSKTKSWSGEIDNNLGSKKIIKGDGFIVDRDINGARGILLKQLSRVA